VGQVHGVHNSRLKHHLIRLSSSRSTPSEISRDLTLCPKSVLTTSCVQHEGLGRSAPSLLALLALTKAIKATRAAGLYCIVRPLSHRFDSLPFHRPNLVIPPSSLAVHNTWIRYTRQRKLRLAKSRGGTILAEIGKRKRRESSTNLGCGEVTR
jgi:hypothetical protein